MKDFNALIRDTLPSKNPAGSWQQGKNMLLSKGYRSIANEDGFKFEYLIKGTIIGVIATTVDLVYFSKNEDGTDEIGVVNTNNNTPTYTTIIKSSLFNFQYNCPIEGVFIYNYNNELIVAWCDGVKDNSNTPKVMNLTNPPLDLNVDGTVIDIKEFTKLSMFPNVNEATIDLSYLDSGAIEGWSAFVTYAYVFGDNTPTYYFSPNTIAYLGTGVDPINKKGVRVTFSNLDTNFSKIRIGLVVKNEGSLVGYESYDISYTGTDKIVDITSLNNFTTTSVDNIILQQAIFDKVNTMTKQEEQLELGNITTVPQIDFQKYANKLTVKPYKTIPSDSNQVAGLMPDEVYSLYIELQDLQGVWSDGFHIPGRVAEGTEADDLTAQQILDNRLEWTETSESAYKQFHFYNNGSIVDGSTKMGFWQNEEKYPNEDAYNSTNIGGADLRNTPIRYHRMPSIRSMYEEGEKALQGQRVFVGQAPDPNYVAGFIRIGIEVLNFADVVPQDILDKIQGYRLSYVKRTSGNSYVAGNYIMGRRNKKTWYQSGVRNTYDYTDFSGIDPDSATPTVVDFNYSEGRLFSTELFKYKPTLDLTYIRANYFFTASAFGTTFEANPIENEYQFGKVRNNLKYIQGDNIASNTQYMNEAIDIDISYNDQLGGADSTKYIHRTTDADAATYRMVNCTAFSHKVNLYSGFKSIKLAVIARTSDFGNNVAFIGGDVFNATTISIESYAPIVSDSVGHDQLLQNVVTISTQGLYSPTNNAEAFNEKSIYAGIVLSSLHVMGDNSDPDAIETTSLMALDYNIVTKGEDDFSEILDINTIFTFDPNTTYVHKFPYRIQRGLKIGNESLTTESLRYYLVNDYYEMPNDKGEIIALRGSEKTLYIQHRFTLFVASIKETLQTPTGEAVYLGRGDLFDRPPSELLNDVKGFIGSVSKFACIIVKGMYITVNQVTGQIFTVKQGVKEISAQGNTNWFENNWDIGLDFFELDANNEKRRIDNPYISVGHLVGYDKQYNRLLFTKRDFEFIGDLTGVTFDGEFYTKNGVKLEYTDTAYFNNKSKTISYSLAGDGGWAFEHDYFPNLIFHTFSNLFSVTNLLNGVERAKVYKHNDPLTKGVYYGKKFESYIDLIFNQNLNISKLYQSINWITDTVENSGGINRQKTITHIAIYNNNQCSGVINLKDHHYNLTRNVQDEWNFNEFKDLIINPSNPILKENGEIDENNINNVKLWFDKSNFISKFIVVRLIIDNQLNDSVYIHEVKVKSIISNR